MPDQSQADRWAAALAAVSAEQVKYLRKERSMSAADLSERCAEIGFPIKLSVLQKFELGYRKYLTTAEMLTIAAALNVSPMHLLLPLKIRQDINLDQPETTIEVLPGQHKPSAEALAWVRGDAWLLPQGWFPSTERRLAHYLQADQCAVEVRRVLGRWEPDPENPGADRRPARWNHEFDHAVAKARYWRQQLREMGHPAPPLPLGLEWIDQVEEQPTTTDRPEAQP